MIQRTATFPENGIETQDTLSLQPIVNVIGERVALGPFERSLLPNLQRWLNDYHVVRTWVGPPQPRDADSVAGILESFRRDDRKLFAIYELGVWRPIGFTCLVDIEYPDRRAEFGIMIGEADCRGRGYGTEAARLTLDAAFTGLGLHNVYLRVAEYNRAGQRAYEKAGFRECGRRHECKLLNGRLWDVVLMECIGTEFNSPVLGRVLAPDELP